MKFHTVVEVIEKSPNAPRIFSNRAEAKKVFKKMVKENDAEVNHTDEYCQIADCSRNGVDYVVAITFNQEVDA